MVSSLDGYMPKKTILLHGLRHLTTTRMGTSISEQDQEKFLKSIDCYVMGSGHMNMPSKLSKSFGWAYGEVPTFVLTHRKLQLTDKTLKTYSGDLNKFVKETTKTKLQECLACRRC
jgi:hypothetical protein